MEWFTPELPKAGGEKSSTWRGGRALQVSTERDGLLFGELIQCSV